MRSVGRARALGCALALALAFGVVAPSPARAADTVVVQGTVTASGTPLPQARVSLYLATDAAPTRLAQTTSDASGAFSLSYTPPSTGVLYVDAAPADEPRFQLRAVVGVAGNAGAVPPTTASSVTVNELTTVAAAYALAQFSDPTGVRGPSPGLENAGATAAALADVASGRPGGVVTNADNGSKNDTLATLNTLANLVTRCAPGKQGCARVLGLATPSGSTRPNTTVDAVVELARNPTLAPRALFNLARGATTYQPALTNAPRSWILVLLYTASGLYASGRIAIDAKGNVWSSNNWIEGTQDGSPYVTAMDPVGAPIFGSPISGGGMKGGAWGMAIAPDNTVWAGSFGGAAISQYSASGTPLSPSTGWTGGGPNHPQGVAVDQKGNVWIANNFGPESEPGQGNVVVYPGGDPTKAITITGGGLNHPFAIQIDGYGRAWVTNAGLGGAKLVDTRLAPLIGKFGGSVTVIGPDFKPTSFSPIEDSSFKWPLSLSIDAQNNAWTVNYFGSTVTRMSPSGTVTGVFKLPRGTTPWGNAVDGSGRVWVAGFTRPAVWLLCGSSTKGCPPGSKTGAVLSPRDGFPSKAFQHFTSIQLDQSGNVWLSNNWSNLVPPVGGVGIAEIVGAATPVCTPLQPLPTKPATSGIPCPAQRATPQ